LKQTKSGLDQHSSSMLFKQPTVPADRVAAVGIGCIQTVDRTWFSGRSPF
jgi:hypothetical protein